MTYCCDVMKHSARSVMSEDAYVKALPLSATNRPDKEFFHSTIVFIRKSTLTISNVPKAEAQFSNVCPTSSIKFTSKPPKTFKKQRTLHIGDAKKICVIRGKNTMPCKE